MTEADWMRVWQTNTPVDADPDKLARAIMAQTWKFDQKIFRRNTREYAAGVLLLVGFAVQLGMGFDRIGAIVGMVSVAFVLLYLWWKHRRLQPLDPASDVAAYKAALIARYDDQIRLLRYVPYWYLLPLYIWPLWIASRIWRKSPAAAIVVLLVMLAFYIGIGWLNVVAGTRMLRAARDKVESMFPQE
jgi:uncharacterized membrane protein